VNVTSLETPCNGGDDPPLPADTPPDDFVAAYRVRERLLSESPENARSHALIRRAREFIERVEEFIEGTPALAAELILKDAGLFDPHKAARLGGATFAAVVEQAVTLAAHVTDFIDLACGLPPMLMAEGATSHV
jgi:hypothetical protein